MWETLLDLIKEPVARTGVILGGSLLVAALLRVILGTWMLRLTSKTKTDLDDQLVDAVKRPLMVTVMLVGVAWSMAGFTFQPSTLFVLHGVLKSLAVLVWTVASIRLGSALLRALSRHSGKVALVQPRTLPLFEILAKVAVVGGAVYFFFLAWDINVTGWLASAGIVGIAVGFAAKDTLANLFAGFFILADAPYRLGDFVVLDNHLRGRVTEIGFRSTRILTRDDIEVYVPNAVIANSKVVNETGGPYEKERVRAKIGVAYGSDVDQVREVLLDCGKGVPYVTAEPAPRVRFRAFGDSSLDFELLVWIQEPMRRGAVLDAINTRIYKALNKHGIQIPFPQRDIYIKEMPTQETPAGASDDPGIPRR